MKRVVQKQLIPISLFLFFSGFYLFTTQEAFSAADGITNYLTTQALVETGSFILDIDCDSLARFVQVRPDGQCYGKYDVGLSLTSLPLYMIGRLVDKDAYSHYTDNVIPKLFVSTLNQFVTAATCSVLYLLALEMSASRKSALELAVLYGLATIAWPYAVSYFSQPLVGLLLVTAVFFLLRFNKNRLYILGAGIALGWSIITRTDSVPLVFLVVIYAIYHFHDQSISKSDFLKKLLLLAIPLVIALAGVLLFNQIRSGNLFQNSYEGEGWTGIFWQGIYGLLISSGRGIIFYSPLVILAIPGLLWLWREEWQAEVALIIGLLLIQLIMYSFWWTWDAGWVWGPRFLVSTQPLLMLGLLPWLRQPRYKLLLLSVVVISFFIQIVGVSTSPAAYILRTNYTYAQTLYKPIASPLLGHTVDLLNKRVFLLIPSHARGVLSNGQTAVWAFVSIGLMGVGGAGLSRAMKQFDVQGTAVADRRGHGNEK